MLFATSIFDEKQKKYRTISKNFAKKFIKEFKYLFVRKIDRNSGTYLFAKTNENEYRLGLWINNYIPNKLIFKKNKFKYYYTNIRIPKRFIGIKYKNKNIRSILLLPQFINIDKNFSRRLGIFASDGFKKNILGIRNTELLLVKELIKLFRSFDTSKKRLQITKKEQGKYKEQYCFCFSNKVLSIIVNKLHIKFLDLLLKYPKRNKELIAGYIQGFHAGDGCCSKRSIQIVSYKGDPAIEFIKKISKKLNLNIGYINNKNKNYEILEFLGLPTYLKFYKNYIWSPKKLKKATLYLRGKDPFILFNKRFLKNLSYRNLRELESIFKTDVRTIYRYRNGDTFIPFKKILALCKKERITPHSLIDKIEQIKTSKEVYNNQYAKEIYEDFLRINGK